MIDELVVATSVLAGFTAALVGATLLYAYYTKEQVKLLKKMHKLTRVDIAVKASAAMGGVVPAIITKETVAEKLKELDLETE